MIILAVPTEIGMAGFFRKDLKILGYDSYEASESELLITTEIDFSNCCQILAHLLAAVLSASKPSI